MCGIILVTPIRAITRQKSSIVSEVFRNAIFFWMIFVEFFILVSCHHYIHQCYSVLS
jgi:hypothetical protein